MNLRSLGRKNSFTEKANAANKKSKLKKKIQTFMHDGDEDSDYTDHDKDIDEDPELISFVKDS